MKRYVHVFRAAALPRIQVLGWRCAHELEDLHFLSNDSLISIRNTSKALILLQLRTPNLSPLKYSFLNNGPVDPI